MAVDYSKIIRIPNLPIGRWADENGMPTDDFLTFMQGLLTQLQLLMGNEGLVSPSQDTANMTIIQDNTTVPFIGGPVTYTCQFGTFLYIPSTTTFPVAPNDSLMVSMNDGTVDQAPIFKTVQVI